MAQTETKLSEMDSLQIKTEIDRTLAEIDDTVDRLSERLRPRHVLDRALDAYRGEASGKAKEWSSQVGEAVLEVIRRNPVPIMIVAAGVAWIVYDEWEHYQRQKEQEESASPRTECPPAVGASGQWSGAPTGRGLQPEEIEPAPPF